MTDRDSLLAEVLSFAEPGDESFADALVRFFDAEEKRKLRSRRPIDHLLLRLDLSRFPLPVSVRAGPALDGVPSVVIRVLAAERELQVDVHFAEYEFTNPLCPDSASDVFLERIRAALADVWHRAFDHVFATRSAQQADDLLLEREQARGFEFDGKIAELHRATEWEKRRPLPISHRKRSR